MAKPRSFYVDQEQPGFYHITSRCVRQLWLMGTDKRTGKNYNHRKDVLLDRIKHLSRFFAVNIYAYAIMSNHFHLVIRYDPKACEAWSDEEVARRWCAAFNGLPFEKTLYGPTELDEFNLTQSIRYHDILLDPERLQRCRKNLGSVSKFMKHVKQPFAVWVNKEEGCKGHVFESRFYSGALLTEQDIMACMGYVDLNPVEAKMVQTLKANKDTSINERLYKERFNAKKLDAYLAPLWEDEEAIEAEKLPVLPYPLKHYADQLNLAIIYYNRGPSTVLDKVDGWMAMILNRERKKRSQDPAFFDYA